MPEHYAHFRDPHDCTFYESHSRAFVLSNEQSQNRLCNRLSRSRLDTCLHVREEGPRIKDFKPDCVIDHWWTEKEIHLKSCPHNYPAKKHPRLNSAEYADLSTLTMSDLENSDDEECFSL